MDEKKELANKIIDAEREKKIKAFMDELNPMMKKHGIYIEFASFKFDKFNTFFIESPRIPE